MPEQFDEFSKSLAQPVPRRESLRRLGLALTTTVLGPLGSQFAWAGKGQVDPCRAFCQCRNSRQKDQCLKACNACGKDPGRLGGSCGSYICCGSGQTSCGSYCADLAGDPDNCGVCGHVCAAPGPSEYGTCLLGECAYACMEGAIDCNGACSFLDADPWNCGGCGIVCGGAAAFCFEGVCRTCEEVGGTYCGGECVNLLADSDNCGACGNVCDGLNHCVSGACELTCIPDCGPGSTHGAGWCGDDGCGGRCACTGEGEYCPAYSNWCAISMPTDDWWT